MKFGYLTLGVALLAALPAYAHEAKSLHGGRLVDAGPYHVELVTKDTAIEIFLIGEKRQAGRSERLQGRRYFQAGRKGRTHHARTFGKEQPERNSGHGPAGQSQGSGSAHGAGWQDGNGAIRLDAVLTARSHAGNGATPSPSLRAKRSNPSIGRRKAWIASSLSLLAMTWIACEISCRDAFRAPQSAPGSTSISGPDDGFAGWY